MSYYCVERILSHNLNGLSDLQCGSYFIPLWIIKSDTLFLNVYQQTLLNLAPLQLHKLANQLEEWKNNMYTICTKYNFKLPSFPEIFYFH